MNLNELRNQALETIPGCAIKAYQYHQSATAEGCRTCHFTRREESWHYIGDFVAVRYFFRVLVSLSFGGETNNDGPRNNMMGCNSFEVY